jgi:hypothetical protein
MEVQIPMVFFVASEVEREHRPSSGDCDIWLGLKFEGRRGVSSTSLKFRTPTCIEPNQGAQTQNANGSRVSSVYIFDRDTKKTAGSELTSGSPSAFHRGPPVTWKTYWNGAPPQGFALPRLAARPCAVRAVPIDRARDGRLRQDPSRRTM